MHRHGGARWAMSNGRQTRDGAKVRRVQVMLDDATIERAKALGDGNLSAGIRAMAKEPNMTPEQIKMRDEIMARYDHVELKWPGHLERTTGAEVLLRCAANEVVFARWRHPGVTKWRNELPIESQGSLVGDYFKALRTGTIREFNARLDAIADPEERRQFITVMNARNTFIDDHEWMRNVAEALYAINEAQSLGDES